MTRQTDGDGDSSTLLLILAGILASFLMLAIVIVFAGWFFYRSMNVANDTRPDQALPVSTKLATTAPRSQVDLSPEEVPGKRVRSTQVSDQTESQPAPQSDLNYSWEPAKPLVYEFEIEADVNSRKIKYRGRNTIRGSGNRPKFKRSDEEREGSGTGFVIDSDGIVVTCAHVVEDASSIKATIGKTTFDATVIEIDAENDLAFLRVNADRLPFLQLADSDEVRLGQGVRAIGFPLSDVLGKTVKVSRGEVSGRGGPGGVDGLQIDASINPGNSGGPLVDNSGRLVGVTSSLLAGVGISEVGFAVPSNKVIEMAKRLSISVKIQEKSSELSTPEVIDIVSPATVLLEVKTGVANQLPYELTYSSYWDETSSPDPRAFMSMALQHKRFNGTILVSETGDVLKDDPRSNLPWLVGNSCRVGIEPLPNSAPGRSTSTQLILFQGRPNQQSRPDFGLPGFPGFGSRRVPPWMRRSRPEPDNPASMLGNETTTIVLGKPTDKGIELDKTYSLRVKGEEKDDAPLVIEGTGKGHFDPIAGRMLDMNYNLTVKIEKENITLRVPVAMTYRIVSEQKLQKEKIAYQERVKARAEKKANAISLSPKKSTSRRSATKRPRSKDESKLSSVKDAPKSSNLNKFNFEK